MSEPNKAKRDLKSIGRAVSKRARSTGQSAEQTIRTAGQNVESVREATVESARDVTARSAEVTEGVAAQSRRLMGEGIGSIRQAVPWDNVLPDDVLSTLSSSLMTSKELSSVAKRKLAAQLRPAFDSLSSRGINPQVQTFATLQGLLANADLSRAINDWLQGLVAGTPTIYDRAMDATYNATHIGGGLHRMFDGSHTIPGAFQAVRNASPDDNIFQEAAGLLQALARDATTPMGLPLVNWDQDTFYILAGTLENLGISRDWLRDMVSYDAVELVGSSIGVLAIALNWNNEDVEEFSILVGGMGLSAAVSANPLLLIVTIVALAKAFHTARKTGDWKEFSDGLAKGGICTGAVLLVMSLVGGPTVVVLLAGICVGVVAHRATENVSVVEIGQFVVRQVSNAPTTTKNALESIKT